MALLALLAAAPALAYTVYLKDGTKLIAGTLGPISFTETESINPIINAINLPIGGALLLDARAGQLLGYGGGMNTTTRVIPINDPRRARR